VSQAPAVLASARDRWLERRRDLVTASDAAAILGFDHRRKPSDVYLEKLGLREPDESEPMVWGRRFETGIAEGYAAETGRRVRELPPYEIAMHPDIPWLGATLDRETEIVAGSDEWDPLELKWALSTGDRWDDEPPIYFQIQVQLQVACRARRVGSLTAFVSPFKPPVWADIPRNDAFLANAIPVLEDFRRRMKARDLPSDAEWYSQESVRRLWPTDNGQAVALSREDLALVKEWEVAKGRHSTAEDLLEDLKKRLAIRLGDAASGFLPDGSSLNFKGEIHEPLLCDCGKQVRKGFTKRVLRRWWPRHLRAAVRKLGP
jgi:putative phage-type endonuclease